MATDLRKNHIDIATLRIKNNFEESILRNECVPPVGKIYQFIIIAIAIRSIIIYINCQQFEFF